MKKLITEEQKENEISYERYKRLIRSLRRERIEKVNPKQVGNNLSKS